MQELDFIIPTDRHIRMISEDIKQCDKDELIHAGSTDIHETIISSCAMSKTCVISAFKDVPLVIYGMFPMTLLSDVATIWMVGTNESWKYKREYFYYTRKVIAAMLEEYRVLTNYVHINNQFSIRFLKCLGAVFEPEHSGFTRFTITRGVE